MFSSTANVRRRCRDAADMAGRIEGQLWRFHGTSCGGGELQ
jgi:hypothetical protein